MNLNQVKELHNRILNIAENIVSCFEQLETFSDKDIKSLETADKIIREAIELKQKETPITEESVMSIEELSGDFE